MTSIELNKLHDLYHKYCAVCELTINQCSAGVLCPRKQEDNPADKKEKKLTEYDKFFQNIPQDCVGKSSTYISENYHIPKLTVLRYMKKYGIKWNRKITCRRVKWSY